MRLQIAAERNPEKKDTLQRLLEEHIEAVRLGEASAEHPSPRQSEEP
jgi:hypothetical protein